MSKTEDTINVKFSFKGLGKSVSEDQTSALVRPYRLLVEAGKPIGKITYIFFSYSSATYVVGSLCHTPAGRILFFPGIMSRIPLWSCEGKKLAFTRGKTSRIDHITLESDLESSHITLLEQSSTKGYCNTFHTYKYTEKGVYYWFGLSLRSESVLERLPEEFAVSIRSPPADSKRRLSIILESHENAINHETLLLDVPRPIPNFLHFDFIIEFGRQLRNTSHLNLFA